MIDNVFGRVGLGTSGGTITDGLGALIGNTGEFWIMSSLAEFGRVSPFRVGGDVKCKGGGVRRKGGDRNRVVVGDGDVGGGGGGGSFSNSIRFLKGTFVSRFTAGASTSRGGYTLTVLFILDTYYSYTNASINIYVCLG